MATAASCHLECIFRRCLELTEQAPRLPSAPRMKGQSPDGALARWQSAADRLGDDSRRPMVRFHHAPFASLSRETPRAWGGPGVGSEANLRGGSSLLGSFAERCVVAPRAFRDAPLVFSLRLAAVPSRWFACLRHEGRPTRCVAACGAYTTQVWGPSGRSRSERLEETRRWRVARLSGSTRARAKGVADRAGGSRGN